MPLRALWMTCGWTVFKMCLWGQVLASNNQCGRRGASVGTLPVVSHSHTPRKRVKMCDILHTHIHISTIHYNSQTLTNTRTNKYRCTIRQTHKLTETHTSHTPANKQIHTHTHTHTHTHVTSPHTQKNTHYKYTHYNSQTLTNARKNNSQTLTNTRTNKYRSQSVLHLYCTIRQT